MAISKTIRYYDTAVSLNSRQERFCGHVVAGKPAGQAYALSGYTSKSPDQEASNLVRIPKIARRIEQLRAKAAKRSEISVDTIVAELEAARVGATAAQQYSAAVAASVSKARLLGLIVDKAEVASVVRKPSRTPIADTKLSLVEWQRRFSPKHVGTGPVDDDS